MRSVEMVARTKEEALELALKELQTEEDQVDVEVLEESSSKGLLGLINVNKVRIRVTMKEDLSQKAARLLREILVNMGISAQVEVFKRDDHITLNITGEDLGRIIGRRGQTLNSLQYLLNLAVNKGRAEKERIIVDVAGYRKKKEESLKKLALRSADRVKRYGKKEILYPMSPYERRIIHLALQNNDEIMTYSEGEEPYRRVIISPQK
ncbi:MAG TPA: protein jag [Firmicutes bacterium]|nr:protein jag [Bacillota bacterium]